ncbi:MAG: hypothetical protein HKO12_08970 [Woeseiaceae bacterium]|nr:hypothetical protein [Woeseiaceae bacterium]
MAGQHVAPSDIADGVARPTLLNAVSTVLVWLGLDSLYKSFDIVSMLGVLMLMGTMANNPVMTVGGKARAG